LIENVQKTGQACFHCCHAGLVDFAFPVSIKSGTIPIIGGQFLFEPCTEAQEAELIGRVRDLAPDSRDLKEALKAVPVIPLQTIKSIVAFVLVVLEQSTEREALEIMERMSGRQEEKQENSSASSAF